MRRILLIPLLLLLVRALAACSDCTSGTVTKIADGPHGCETFRVYRGWCNDVYYTRCPNAKADTQWEERHGKSSIEQHNSVGEEI